MKQRQDTAVRTCDAGIAGLQPGGDPRKEAVSAEQLEKADDGVVEHLHHDWSCAEATLMSCMHYSGYKGRSRNGTGIRNIETAVQHTAC